MNFHHFLSLEEINDLIDHFISEYHEISKCEVMCLSEDGQEIKAVHVTDKDVPLEEKEIIMIVCGRHGNERGTRVVGPALLDWLRTDEARKTLASQHIIVVPVVNPDGCVKEEFHAPDDRLSNEEESTIATLARKFIPDAVMDVHSWGGILDGEGVIMGNTGDHAEDHFIYHTLAQKMNDDACLRGYPFRLKAAKRVPGQYNNFFSGMCYNEYHSLAFGMEVNHESLTSQEAAESGLAILRSLILTGNTKHSFEQFPGYPNRIIKGDFATSIRACGNNPGQRRSSRKELWRNRDHFTRPDRKFYKGDRIVVRTEYSGEPLASPFSLVCRVRKKVDVRKVTLNGVLVDPLKFTDECSTYYSVEIGSHVGREVELILHL